MRRASLGASSGLLRMGFARLMGPPTTSWRLGRVRRFLSSDPSVMHDADLMPASRTLLDPYPAPPFATTFHRMRDVIGLDAYRMLHVSR
jgi:hypothetical protein